MDTIMIFNYILLSVVVVAFLSLFVFQLFWYSPANRGTRLKKLCDDYGIDYEPDAFEKKTKPNLLITLRNGERLKVYYSDPGGFKYLDPNSKTVFPVFVKGKWCIKREIVTKDIMDIKIL